MRKKTPPRIFLAQMLKQNPYFVQFEELEIPRTAAKTRSRTSFCYKIQGFVQVSFFAHLLSLNILLFLEKRRFFPFCVIFIYLDFAATNL